MAKKGESDEKVQAGTGPETLGTDVPGEPDQREAAALVAGGDPGAVEGERDEPQPGEPAEPTGESAGVVSDGNDGMERHGAGAVDGDFIENDAEKLDGAHGPNAEIPSASGAGDNVQGHDADSSADGVSNGGDAAGTGSAGGDLDDGPIDFGDLALGAAVEAYEAVLMAGAILGATIAGTDALDVEMSDGAYDDMAAFVRKIGKRATPEVMGQQLKILGHRASAEISEPERMALAVFVTALVDLDAFAAAEAARIAAEKNPPAPAPKLPIDETTLEPVDDYFATWA